MHRPVAAKRDAFRVSYVCRGGKNECNELTSVCFANRIIIPDELFFSSSYSTFFVHLCSECTHGARRSLRSFVVCWWSRARIHLMPRSLKGVHLFIVKVQLKILGVNQKNKGRWGGSEARAEVRRWRLGAKLAEARLGWTRRAAREALGAHAPRCGFISLLCFLF